jgi:hypothetical protein
MHVFRLKTRLRHQRLGISLLEVIISIGVASVGLLGVLALIPLGGAQARQGQIYESAARIGVSAIGEVRARDMLNPNNISGMAGLGAQSREAFCIDPLYVAAGGSSIFPINAPLPMPRVTLNNGSGSPMNQALAASIFRSHDDLSLSLDSSDRTLPPSQVWSRDGGVATRRQSEGTMSWMLTVHPNLAHNSSYDLWTVSVVVFNRRIIDANIRGEFTANVTSLPGGGISGGDIEIAFDTATYSTDDINEAKTPENSWVLLTARRRIIVGYDMNGEPIYGYIHVSQWYRVLASDNTGTTEPAAANRVLTLSGPDWPVDPVNILDVQATIIPSTVAVFQENMRLEIGKGTSLWRN